MIVSRNLALALDRARYVRLEPFYSVDMWVEWLQAARDVRVKSSWRLGQLSNAVVVRFPADRSQYAFELAVNGSWRRSNVYMLSADRVAFDITLRRVWRLAWFSVWVLTEPYLERPYTVGLVVSRRIKRGE